MCSVFYCLEVARLHCPGQPPFCPPFSLFFSPSLCLKQAVEKLLAWLAPYELLVTQEIGLGKGGKSEHSKVVGAGFAPQSEASQSMISEKRLFCVKAQLYL